MNKIKQLSFILLCAIWLIACSGSEPEPAAEEVSEVDPTAVPATEEATPEPTAEPTAEPTEEPALDLSDFTPFESAEEGFRLMHPNDWLAEDFFGMILLATSEEAMDIETISSGAMTLVMPVPPEELEGESLSDSLEIGLTEMAGDPETGEVTLVQEITEITTASGVPGVTAIATFDRPDGLNITTQLTILAQDGQALTLVSMTPSSEAADITPLFSTIIESAELFPPTAAHEEVDTAVSQEEDGGNNNTETTADRLTPYQSTIAGFTIAYPNSWVVEEFGETVVFATDEAAMDVNRSAAGGMLAVSSITLDQLPADTLRQSLERTIGQFASDPDNSDFQLAQDVTEFTTVSGLNAFTAVMTYDRPDGTNMVMRMSILAKDGLLATATAISHTAEAGDTMTTFDEIVNQIDLFPPQNGAAPSDSVTTEIGSPLDGETISSGLLSGVLVPQPAYGPIAPATAGTPTVYELGAGQVHFIPLNVAANTIVDITVTGLNETDVVIDLLGAMDGPSLIFGPIDYGFETEEISDVGLEAGAEYHILVGGYDQQAGQFSLTITPKEIDTGTSGPTDSTSIASGTITLGIDGPQSGSIAQDETAVWQFDGVEGSTISIVVESTSGADIVFNVIQNATGTSITNGPIDQQFTAPEAITDLVIPTSGSYSIEIRGYDGQASDYILTATTVAGLEVITTTGGQVEFGEIIQGGFAYGESSVWTFNATAGDVVTISAQPLGDLDIVLDVQDSAGKSLTLGSVDSEMSGTAELAAITIQETGTYSIILNGFALADGSYILAVIKQ